MTHVGIIVGCDARTPQGYRRKVRFRETMTMWISESGMRFMKKRNLRTPGDWPMYKLEATPTLIEE